MDKNAKMRDLLADISKFNAQTTGRDKFFRLLQYSSRFLWYWLQKTSNRRDTVARLQNLEVTFSSGRRLLRLGRFVDALHGATRTINLPDVSLRLSLTMARIGNAFYILTDNLVWLHQVGLLTLHRDAWSRTSNKFWLLAIVAALIRDLLELYQILPMLLALPSKGNTLRSSLRILWASASFHKALLLDLVKNFADLWIPYTALGHARLEPGTVGLLGVISSAAAILPMLDSTFSLIPA
ncbi:peroxisomal biogenesis factor 11ab [Dermacentor variabilis]|uniref:peroxisomal biogenesis factor 11ab n=1 Tax=Dermacentor variabilis TaxID=34621 RepID=UPI003F5AE31D